MLIYILTGSLWVRPNQLLFQKTPHTDTPGHQATQVRDDPSPLKSTLMASIWKIRDIRDSCPPYSFPLSEQGLAGQGLEHREHFWLRFPGPSWRVLGKGCFTQLKSNQLKDINSIYKQMWKRTCLFTALFPFYNMSSVYIIKFSKKLSSFKLRYFTKKTFTVWYFSFTWI